MEEHEKHILEEVDKTLKAFDDLPVLEANPFLYTRIQATLSSKSRKNEEYVLRILKLKSFALALIIMLNIITVVYFFRNKDKDYSKDQLISALSRDYNSTQNDF